jgi:F-type H+-transporting ATPase subunit b
LTGCTRVALVAGAAALIPATAWAAEGGDWRPTYDLIMRWVNFLILVFVIAKFARTPLRNFLSGQKDTITREIQAMEESRQAAQARISEIKLQLEEISGRMEKMKARIVTQGERRKQEIIETAQRESRIMLDSAKVKIAGRMNTAKQTIRDEMVDIAVQLAMQKLPGEITATDNDGFLDHYLTAAGDP